MTEYRKNPRVERLTTPPIAEVQTWLRPADFGPEYPLFDVSQAVPSYGPPTCLLNHLAEQLHHADTSLYTDIVGTPELRSALSLSINREYGGVTTPDQIAITAGCNQTFCAVVDAITQPGDEIILTLPCYFNHLLWLQIRNITVRYAPFNPSAEPRWQDIESCITDATRAIVLVTPNNPTGLEYSSSMIDNVFTLARNNGIALITDETYKDFRQNTGPPHLLHQHDDWHDNLIQLFSFSKSFALTGHRVGAVAASADFIPQIAKILDNIAICPPHPGQIAALYGLNHLTDWRRDKANIIRNKVSRLRQSFNRRDLNYALAFSGTYFAYIQHPFGGQNGIATKVARRLAREFNILCLPGSMFGPGQESYLRFAFANIEEEAIPALVDRLVASQD